MPTGQRMGGSCRSVSEVARCSAAQVLTIRIRLNIRPRADELRGTDDGHRCPRGRRRDGRSTGGQRSCRTGLCYGGGSSPGGELARSAPPHRLPVAGPGDRQRTFDQCPPLCGPAPPCRAPKHARSAGAGCRTPPAVWPRTRSITITWPSTSARALACPEASRRAINGSRAAPRMSKRSGVASSHHQLLDVGSALRSRVLARNKSRASVRRWRRGGPPEVSNCALVPDWRRCSSRRSA